MPSPSDNRSHWCIVVAAVVVGAMFLSSCDVTLVRFDMPSRVAAGAVFEVAVVADALNGASNESAGVILQLPFGFVVLESAPNDPGSSLGITSVQNDPAYVALLAPEPGHTIFTFSGTSSSAAPSIGARIKIRAPTGPGTGTVKAALAAWRNGNLIVQSPGSVTNFASVTAAANVRVIEVAAPLTPEAPDLVDESVGLPGYRPVELVAATAADIDGNGIDDLLALDIVPSPLGTNSIAPRCFFRTSSSSWFEVSTGLQPLAFVSTGAIPNVACGDFDGDGDQDVAVGLGQVWLRNQIGNWVPAAGSPTPNNTDRVAVGDFNGDGFDDLVFASVLANRLEAYRSLGNGAFAPSSSGLPTAMNPLPGVSGGRRIRLADLNNDGHLDILWSRRNAPGIWLGNGAGAWQEVTSSGLATGIDFQGLDSADFDGDGLQDIVVAATAPSCGSMTAGIRLYRHGPTLAPHWNHIPISGLPTNGLWLDVRACDIDQDGDPDVVAAHNDGFGGLETFINDGTGHFFQGSPALVEGSLRSWLVPIDDIVIGTFTNDQMPDFALTARNFGLVAYSRRPNNLLGGCAAGTVRGFNGSFGYPVLTINGTPAPATRTVRTAIGQPFVIGMGQPPLSTFPGEFVLWGVIGIPEVTDAYLSPFGGLCFAPFDYLPISDRFVLAHSLDPNVGAVPSNATPWTHVVPSGLLFPFDVTLQGLILDGPLSLASVAVTNALVLRVE